MNRPNRPAHKGFGAVWGDGSGMVGGSGKLSNHPSALSSDLTSVFETLADWESQLQSVPAHERKYLEDIFEEPTP